MPSVLPPRVDLVALAVFGAGLVRALERWAEGLALAAPLFGVFGLPDDDLGAGMLHPPPGRNALSERI
jgi:hypothetical protein